MGIDGNGELAFEPTHVFPGPQITNFVCSAAQVHILKDGGDGVHLFARVHVYRYAVGRKGTELLPSKTELTGHLGLASCSAAADRLRQK